MKIEAKKEKHMSATSPAAFVKKSVGWSIALSVLMIVAGILAIASPLAAGIAELGMGRRPTGGDQHAV
jgi:uncharacterized membrane protein HdeD (DUF308 family)